MKLIPSVVAICGSPAPWSKMQKLLDQAGETLRRRGCNVAQVELRALPAEALYAGNAADENIALALKAVHDADAVILGTPIYKNAFSGLAKLFLDLLPRDGLRGKPVLPLAIGSGAAHTLMLDYALPPVLGALGTRRVLASIFAGESQVRWSDKGLQLDADVQTRLRERLEELHGLLPAPVLALPEMAPALRVLNFTGAPQHC